MVEAFVLHSFYVTARTSAEGKNSAAEEGVGVWYLFTHLCPLLDSNVHDAIIPQVLGQQGNTKVQWGDGAAAGEGALRRGRILPPC